MMCIHTTMNLVDNIPHKSMYICSIDQNVLITEKVGHSSLGSVTYVTQICH